MIKPDDTPASLGIEDGELGGERRATLRCRAKPPQTLPLQAAGVPHLRGFSAGAPSRRARCLKGRAEALLRAGMTLGPHTKQHCLRIHAIRRGGHHPSEEVLGRRPAAALPRLEPCAHAGCNSLLAALGVRCGWRRCVWRSTGLLGRALDQPWPSQRCAAAMRGALSTAAALRPVQYPSLITRALGPVVPFVTALTGSLFCLSSSCSLNMWLLPHAE